MDAAWGRSAARRGLAAGAQLVGDTGQWCSSVPARSLVKYGRRPIRLCPVDEVKDIKVEATYLSGARVYARPAGQ